MYDGTEINGDEKPNRFWAHARSCDMINWEYLPFALVPDRKHNEIKPISGSVVRRKNETHTLFFTSIRQNRSEYVQCMAVSNDGLLTWSRLKEPVLPFPDWLGIDPDWRDPFVVQYGNKYYMIVGASTQADSLVLLYRTTSEDLTKWEYCDVLISKPRDEVCFFECPRLFFLDGKAILIFSPYGQAKYYVCDIRENFSMNIIGEGVVDYGLNAYATQNITLNNGKVALISLVPGWFSSTPVNFPHWNGCFGLPRTVSLNAYNQLIQLPLKDYTRCRSKEVLNLSSCTYSLDLSVLPEFEVMLQFEPYKDFDYKINFLNESTGVQIQTIEVNRHGICINGVSFPISDKISIHCYCDHFLWEYFFQDGIYCYTSISPDVPQKIRIVLDANNNLPFLDFAKVFLIERGKK